MIPRKLQEGPRADSARKSPSLLTRSPVGGDAAGQRKEGECFCQARLVPVTMDVVMARRLGPRQPSHWPSAPVGLSSSGGLGSSGCK